MRVMSKMACFAHVFMEYCYLGMIKAALARFLVCREG